MADLKGDWRNAFYRRYFSTHILGPKGRPTVREFAARTQKFNREWGGLIPTEKNARIVDVGCGSGSLLWWLQRVGYAEAEGVDISPEQCEIARELGVRNVCTSDVVAFLCERRSRYDAIIMRDVLEHLTKPEILECLQVCHHSLRSGGRLLLQVPNAETPFFGRIRYGDFTHEVAFTVRSLQQILGVTGFRDYTFCPRSSTSRSWKTMGRFALWKIVEGIYRALIYAERGQWNAIVTETLIAQAFKDEAAKVPADGN